MAWNDRELADWSTPLRGLGLRPGFYSEAEFAKIRPQTLYRSYPAYHPDREPPGYWEWLQNQAPQPLLDSTNLRTQHDWIEAGRLVFRDLYQAAVPANARMIPLIRSRDALARAGIKPLPDGTLPLLWVVTPEGVLPARKSCQSCHTRYLPDGTILDGAPANHQGAGMQRLRNSVDGILGPFQNADIATLREEAYRREGTPWLPDDAHAVTKVIDLIGVRDRKYLDHTATHVNRGVADLMRYAWHVECCNAEVFGPYRLRPVPPATRPPDDVIFALATYIYSLAAPPSPYLGETLAADGKKVFERTGCAACHTPPLYTNNKLTLAKGFTPSADHPFKNDIMPISVGTDPGRAMQTRVGTGLYKVPSLKGLWYRGLLGHQGDVATLEEWFDRARLRDDYVPSGWQGFKQTHRAVPGHEFGLNLTDSDKRALIAFLRTL
jgi:hypothetical protein